MLQRILGVIGGLCLIGVSLILWRSGLLGAGGAVCGGVIAIVSLTSTRAGVRPQAPPMEADAASGGPSAATSLEPTAFGARQINGLLSDLVAAPRATAAAETMAALLAASVAAAEAAAAHRASITRPGRPPPSTSPVFITGGGKLFKPFSISAPKVSPSLARAADLETAGAGRVGWTATVQETSQFGDRGFAPTVGSPPSAADAATDGDDSKTIKLIASKHLKQDAGADPDELCTASDLAAALTKVGDCCDALGRAKDALDAHNESLSLRRLIVARTPEDAAALRGLSLGLARLAATHAARGHRIRALKLYRERLPLAERLAAAQPDDQGLEQDLADTLQQIAALQAKPTDQVRLRRSTVG